MPQEIDIFTHCCTEAIQATAYHRKVNTHYFLHVWAGYCNLINLVFYRCFVEPFPNLLV